MYLHDTELKWTDSFIIFLKKEWDHVKITMEITQYKNCNKI